MGKTAFDYAVTEEIVGAYAGEKYFFICNKKGNVLYCHSKYILCVISYAVTFVKQ